MATRRCLCTHAENTHELVMDGFSRDGSYKGKCQAKNCTCTMYNFDYERWVREDEREKIARGSRKKAGRKRKG